MFGRTKTKVQASLAQVGLKTGTYAQLQDLSEKHCDGELEHEAYRTQVTALIGSMPDAELTRLAEATMGGL